MPQELLIDSIRDSDFASFKELVSSLSLDQLNTPNTIHYSNWFPGIGFTFLQLTSMVRPDYAQPLIDRGVEIDIHSACALGDVECIERLLKEDLGRLDTAIANFYPIQFATKHPEALDILLKYGDNPNREISALAWFDWESKAVERGLSMYKPIHLLAVGRGGVASADCLYKYGADLSATSMPFGEAPIHLAAIYNKASLITWLVKRGIDVDAVTDRRHPGFKLGELFNESHFSPFENSNRKTALMLAAGEGQTATVRQLINLGANACAGDSEGYTPLHYAAGAFWNSNVEIVELLMSAGAYTNSKSNSGLMPRDLARKKKYSAIIELLP